MQEQANVSLSSFELQLVTDPGWILTKNEIIEKVCRMFGGLSELYLKEAEQFSLPSKVLQTSPKISKGENYKGLPYVMLDYPRCFGKEHVLAVRTFFWWGHYYSCTLHFKGQYKHQYESAIAAALTNGLLNGSLINQSNEEWNHDLKEDMKPVEQIHPNLLHELDVIKIVREYSFENWNNVPANLLQQFQLYMRILNS
jgi:hypothetical protein